MITPTRRMFVMIAVLTCAPAMSHAQNVRAPAEWEPHERVWLTWFGQGRRDSVSTDIVKALQPHVKLTMNVASDSMKTNARTFLAAHGIDVNSIDFVVDPNVDYKTMTRLRENAPASSALFAYQRCGESWS